MSIRCILLPLSNGCKPKSSCISISVLSIFFSSYRMLPFTLVAFNCPKSLEVLAYSTFNPFWQTLYPKAVAM